MRSYSSLININPSDPTYPSQKGWLVANKCVYVTCLHCAINIQQGYYFLSPGRHSERYMYKFQTIGFLALPHMHTTLHTTHVRPIHVCWKVVEGVRIAESLYTFGKIWFFCQSFTGFQNLVCLHFYITGFYSYRY